MRWPAMGAVWQGARELWAGLSSSTRLGCSRKLARGIFNSQRTILDE